MKIKNKLIYLSFAALTLGGSLYMTNNLNFTVYLSLVFSAFVMTVLFIKKNKVSYNDTQKTNNILIYLFSITMSISFVLNNTLEDFFNIVGLLLFLLISTVLLPNIGTQSLNLKYIYKTSLYLIPILIFVPIPFIGLNYSILYGYQGIFFNPNSFGIVVSTFLIVVISYFIPNSISKKTSNLSKLMFVSLIITTMILLLLSNSRTSIIVVLVVGCLIILQMFREKNTISFKQKRRLVLILTIGLIIVVFTGVIEELFVNMFLEKFKNNESDITNGRSLVWKEIIDNRRLFGNGRQFLLDLPIAPHSTYFSILAQFGSVNLFIYILIIFRMFRASYLFMTNSMSPYRFLPISITTAFILLSFTEGMLMIYTMFISFLSYGSILDNIKIKK